jgi:hypothetical protein
MRVFQPAANPSGTETSENYVSYRLAPAFPLRPGGAANEAYRALFRTTGVVATDDEHRATDVAAIVLALPKQFCCAPQLLRCFLRCVLTYQSVRSARLLERRLEFGVLATNCSSSAERW